MSVGLSARTRKELEQQGLYSHLYRAIGPSSGIPMIQVPGKTAAAQARAAGYKDIYRNIQAMRDASYKRDIARGEIVKEFSGGLGSYLGAAAKTAVKTTAPGLLIAAALAGAYFFFKRKKSSTDIEEPTTPVEEAEETEEAASVVEDAEASRYYYY